MKLDGAAIVVTGAGGGLGRATAQRLRAAGANLVLLDIAADANAETARLLDLPDQAAIACDLRDEAAVVGAFDVAADQLGRAPQGLVHFAGRIASRPLVNLLAKDDARHPYPAWREIVTDNLDTAFLAGAAAAERMARSRVKGAIVLISSVAAKGNAGQSAYAAAKAGVEALAKTWAKELGPLGVRAVAVAPGFMDTPATHAALGEAGVAARIKATPLRRLGAPDAVSAAVIQALENDYLNGAVIPVDGGTSL